MTLDEDAPPYLQERQIMAKQNPEKAGLYLDDFQVGQHFRSGSHSVDEEQIRTFANRFISTPRRGKRPSSEDS